MIRTILDQAHVDAEADVLDVACGTGVLFPDYLDRKVRTLTGIDISPEMARRAQEKFPQVRVICGDVEEWPFDEQFDVVMVYNAFPHFPDPARLIARLAELTRQGGYLSVAHGMSREKLLAHHAGAASRVSIDLPEHNTLDFAKQNRAPKAGVTPSFGILPGFVKHSSEKWAEPCLTFFVSPRILQKRRNPILQIREKQKRSELRTKRMCRLRSEGQLPGGDRWAEKKISIDRFRNHRTESFAGLRVVSAVLFIVMTIPFRCADGTKRHETSASNAAVIKLLE